MLSLHLKPILILTISFLNFLFSIQPNPKLVTKQWVTIELWWWKATDSLETFDGGFPPSELFFQIC